MTANKIQGNICGLFYATIPAAATRNREI